MILHDTDLHRLCEDGLVLPYEPTHIGPASIDLRLGKKLRRYSTFAVHDPRKSEGVHTDEVDISKDPFRIDPGEFVLGVTRERVVIPPEYAAQVQGRSSIGRLGIMVHVTAGFIDPGFAGYITLEIANVGNRPVLLRENDRVCQLIVSQMKRAPSKPYAGKYQNQGAAPVPSRIHQDRDHA